MADPGVGGGGVGSAPSSVLDNRDLSKVSNVCIPSCSSTLFLPTSAEINKTFYQTNRGPYSGGSRGGSLEHPSSLPPLFKFPMKMK